MSKANRINIFSHASQVGALTACLLCLDMLFSPRPTLGPFGALSANIALPEATPLAMLRSRATAGDVALPSLGKVSGLELVLSEAELLTNIDERTEASKLADTDTSAAREPVQYVALNTATGMAAILPAPRRVGAGHKESFGSGRGPDIFGSLAIAAPNVPLARIAQPAFAIRGEIQGARCLPVADLHCPIKVGEPWISLLTYAQQLSAIEQMEWINSQVNHRVKYVPDIIAHALPDYWSSAYDTMLRQSGDCEDYAILKMWLLQQLGFPGEDLFVVVVQSPSLAEQHAVLAVRTADALMVLDSLSDQLRRDDDVAGYKPIFSINADGLWIHGFSATKEVASLSAVRVRHD